MLAIRLLVVEHIMTQQTLLHLQIQVVVLLMLQELQIHLSQEELIVVERHH